MPSQQEVIRQMNPTITVVFIVLMAVLVSLIAADKYALVSSEAVVTRTL